MPLPAFPLPDRSHLHHPPDTNLPFTLNDQPIDLILRKTPPIHNQEHTKDV
jgi:hypothetical protein